MLDIKFVRENPEVVKQNIRNKFQDNKLELVDKVLELDKENREIKQEVEALRAERNKISKQIGALMAQGKKEEAEEVKKQVAASGTRIEELSTREKEVEEEEKTTTTTAPIFSQEFINLYNSFEQESGRPLSAIQQQELGYMLDEFNADLIYEALKEAVNQGKVNFAYIKAILARWKQDNLLTVDLVRNSKANRNKKEKEETLTSNFPPLPF